MAWELGQGPTKLEFILIFLFYYPQINLYDAINNKVLMFNFLNQLKISQKLYNKPERKRTITLELIYSPFFPYNFTLHFTHRNWGKINLSTIVSSMYPGIMYIGYKWIY